MAETLLALGLLLLLLAGGVLAVVVPWDHLLGLGVLLIALGMLLGVPTGFYYHVLLRRGLGRRGPLPARWWLHPTDWHGAVSDEDRRVMMRWFLTGGAGFVVVVLGCVLLGLGAIRGR